MILSVKSKKISEAWSGINIETMPGSIDKNFQDKGINVSIVGGSKAAPLYLDEIDELIEALKLAKEILSKK